MTQEYKYVLMSGASTKNVTDNFMVLVGFDAEGGFTTSGDVLIVQTDQGAIDTVELEGFGTAASETLIFLPHPMLVPPGATITSPHSAQGILILCKADSASESLQMAVSLL